MPQSILLVPIAVVIGAYGTLIGSGGGFALVPLLLLLYPEERPEVITGISLSVVFIEAAAASIAYGKMKRIDYRSGMLLAVATIPGAVLGAVTTAYTSRHFFDALFGSLLIAEALYLLFRRNALGPGGGGEAGGGKRALKESRILGYSFHFDWKIGVLTSFLVGYISSLLGIGGGIIHLPIMVHLLNFPIKIAAATSLFIILLRSLAGSVTHIPMGSLGFGLGRVICLAVGVFIGAQIGARVSSRIHSRWIVRGLALALVVVGLRILAAAII